MALATHGVVHPVIGLVGKQPPHVRLQPVRLAAQKEQGDGRRRRVGPSRRQRADEGLDQPCSNGLSHSPGSPPKTSVTFCPPNPKLFEATNSTSIGRATFGT